MTSKYAIILKTGRGGGGGRGTSDLRKRGKFAQRGSSDKHALKVAGIIKVTRDTNRRVVCVCVCVCLRERHLVSRYQGRRSFFRFFFLF